VVSEIEERLRGYDDPIEVAVLGCAVNGIGEASHADFGIAGAKDMGVIYSRGKALRKVPTPQLVDVLFEEIDKYYAAGREVVVDEAQAAEGAALLAEIEAESAGDLTPERLAAMEKAASQLDEAESPTDGRRFQRV
jgi:(E)-4-hydroxy-3-methylbut-2-enyl-diphosphate synthase